MEDFLQKCPKVELHAHLNGSLNTSSIQELGRYLYGENTSELLVLLKEFTDFNGLSLNDCFKKFKFMHQLTATKQGLKHATFLVIRDFNKDNVKYLELRTTHKANDCMSKREYLECVLDAIEESVTAFPELLVNVLPSIDRSQPVDAAQDTLDIVLELRQKYPQLVPGMDFSGNPHCGDFKDFLPVLDRARKAGLKLTLHCAEIDKPSEIAEMIHFGMDRCGHGTFLTEAQLKILAERKVAVECCLTSNVKCGTVSNYNDHHFKDIFAAEGIVVLCTDDSGVFDTTLTQEYLLAGRAFDLKIEDYRKLTLNAIDHAFIDNDKKEDLRDSISKYFDISLS